MNELETLLVDFSKVALVGAFLAVVSVVVLSVFRGHAGGPPPRQPALTDALLAALPAPGALSGEASATQALALAKKAAPDPAESVLTMAEGESLSEFRSRLKQSAPAKKSSISAEMLDTANSYDDKVALVRMLVSEDSGLSLIHI